MAAPTWTHTHPHPHTHGDAHQTLHGHAHTDAVQRAVDALRDQGERITESRRAIVELLAREHDHLTAEQVAASLGDTAHRATVYRTLERLAELGIASAIRTPEGAAYHLAVTPAGHEHLHARCRNCGKVVVLPVNSLQGAVDRLRHARLFSLEPGQSDLVGLCPDCAAA